MIGVVLLVWEILKGEDSDEIICFIKRSFIRCQLMLVSVHFSVIPINLALSPLRAQVMDPTIFSDFEYFVL